MKARLSILCFGLAVFNGYAQFELPKKTLKIAPISNPSGQTSPTTSTSSAIKYPSIFDKKDNLAGKFSLLNQKLLYHFAYSVIRNANIRREAYFNGRFTNKT